MSHKVALILSLMPMRPVKSGMQNTIFFLHKYLQQNKVICKFSSFENYNRIDPVINLKFKKQNYKIIEKAISLNKPDYIFVNTSKLLYLYKDLLLKINRKFKIILVGHDLYFFRKRYFKKINVIDKTPLRNKEEIKVIKESDFIIDVTHEEKKYLLSKKIDSKKIIFTNTPVEVNKISKFSKKFDFVYLGSSWRQNILSLNYLYKNLILKLPHLKFLVLGMKKIKGYADNVCFKPFKRIYLMNCSYGLAFVKFGSGRNVKIFDMMSLGIPVITNKRLEAYGLRENSHYVFTKNVSDCLIKISKISKNKNLRKKISKNCYLWSSKNSNYQRAFEKLKKIL
jgi:hypothetical protein